MEEGCWVCSEVWGQVADEEASRSGRETGTEERQHPGLRWRVAVCLEELGCLAVRGRRSVGLLLAFRGMKAVLEGWPELEVQEVDGSVPGWVAGCWSGVWVWHMAGRWERWVRQVGGRIGVSGWGLGTVMKRCGSLSYRAGWVEGLWV